jgi:cytochrome d ubiquinol oxidase subunit I
MATVTKQARKKFWALFALGTFAGLLLLPLFLSFPTGASGSSAAPAASTAPPAATPADAKPVEKSRDVWYKTEGPVVGAPAPKTTDSPKDYPRYNFESRVLLWVGLQQHLYYGCFVLAVPNFCMIVE